MIWRLTLLLAFLILIMPGVAPAFALPSAEVTLVDGFGSESRGVYLGHGLILTSWQNVVAERYLWDVSTRTAPPLRYQLPYYLNDDQIDRDEWASRLWICRHEQSYQVSETPQNKCLSYNLANEMHIVDDKNNIPVSRLLYADRESDIAILEVDQADFETIFSDISPARLDGRPVTINQKVHLDSSEYKITSATPIWQRNPLHGNFDGSTQQSLIISAEQPTTALIGQPYFSEEGTVLGLLWSNDGNFTPTRLWIHRLWQINEQLRHQGLQAVLEEAFLPAVVGEPTLYDPFSPELGNSGYDVLHYSLNLRVAPVIPSLEGQAKLTLKATYHNLAEFSLDLRGMDVDWVTFNGEMIEFEITVAKLLIYLPVPVAYGTSFDIEVRYRGELRSWDTPYSSFFKVGLEYMNEPPRLAFANQPDGASTWFPCNDHPSDRATYQFNITVPENYVGVANGIPADSFLNPDYTITYLWEMNHPMATYLAVVAVGDYTLLEHTTPEGIVVRNYAYIGTEEKVTEVLSSTDLAFSYLGEMFGDYPFESYGHVVTPMQNGAIETQTMSILPRSIVQSDGEEMLFTLVVHELAHHWYGNTVTLKSWKDIWLNEGFATYAEWLALEKRYGQERPTRQLTINENALGATRRKTPLAYPLPNEMFGPESYNKGAWVLHMLRLQLGDNLFFEMLQTWAVEYATHAVTTLDFFRFVEQFTTRDLTRFRRQWLETNGIPEYILLWTHKKNGIEIRACNLREVPYAFNLPVNIMGHDGFTTVDYPLADNAVETFEVDFAVTDITIDPNQQILGKFTVQFTEESPSCLLTLR